MAKKDKNKNKGNVFQNLMQGRYGGDNYGLFLFVTGLALMIIGAIGNNIPGTILMMIATAEIVFAYVRLMSKKYEGLYIIGDGSGITHSLSHASASGVLVAREIAE